MSVNLKRSFVVGALLSLVLGDACAERFLVKSPDGQTVVTLDCRENALSYSVVWDGQDLLGSSALSLVDNPVYTLVGSETESIDTNWNTIWGQFDVVADRCNRTTLKLELSGVRVDLICQVYDDGIGLRFAVPAASTLSGKKVAFLCEYNAAPTVKGYFPNGERMPIGPLSLKQWSKKPKGQSMPAVFDLGAGRYFSILESDLYSAKLFSNPKLAIRKGSKTLYNLAPAKVGNAGFVTPWRVILLGEQLGDMLTNTVAINLAAPCQLEDTDWIKPGVGLWDWRIHGYDNGEFVYGIDTRSYLHLIDFCAEQGLEYLTIDDHWYTHADNGKMDVAPKVDIERVMLYAKEKGVKIMLYYDRKKGDFGDAYLYAHYRKLGASGIKYGFMGNKASFTRGANEGAAKNRLLTNYHDTPVPMTGVGRTLPNAITREYCHAQQDGRRAFTPEGFLKMAMINALSGPQDQANGNFGIDSINAGERKKGPRLKGSYISTVVSEVARAVVLYSSMITLPDAPEEYMKKADLFEFLKQLPATWDESRVLHCRMGQYITTARRSGDSWFVGSVTDETQARSLSIALDFLTPGARYEVTFFEDTPETHGKNNPEAYRVRKGIVQSSDSVLAKMAVGGGHAMILRLIK